MSSDELSVRAAILARTFRKKQALHCIQIGLGKIKRLPDPNAHVLLLSLKAELAEDSDKAEALFRKARNMSGISEMTQVRVIRAHAKHFRKIGEKGMADKNLALALDIAEEAGLTDQTLKLKIA